MVGRMNTIKLVLVRLLLRDLNNSPTTGMSDNSGIRSIVLRSLSSSNPPSANISPSSTVTVVSISRLLMMRSLESFDTDPAFAAIVRRHRRAESQHRREALFGRVLGHLRALGGFERRVEIFPEDRLLPLGHILAREARFDLGERDLDRVDHYRRAVAAVEKIGRASCRGRVCQYV